jgi:hypothetical protein
VLLAGPTVPTGLADGAVLSAELVGLAELGG